MNNFLKLCAILLVLAIPSWAAPNTAVATATNVSSVPASFGSNTTAGSVFVVGGSVSGYQGLSIADSLGNSFVLQPQGCGIDGGSRMLCVWVVYSSVGGADTITLTDTGGGSNQMSVVAAEYTGMAAYPVDKTTTNKLQYNAGTLTTNPATSVTANDVAVAIGFVGGDSGASSTYTATGYTSRASAVTSNNRTSIGLLDETVASPTAGITATVTSGALDGVGFVLLRSVLPTIGNIQNQFCEASSATGITCTLPQNASTSDGIIAATYAGSADDSDDSALQQISGLCSVPWTTAPFGSYGTGGQVIFYCPRASATSSVTLTELSPGSANQTWDVALTEVAGVANSTPIVGLTYNSVNSTTNANSLTISGSGSFYLYNLFEDTNGSNTYTNSGTSLVPQMVVAGNYVKQVNDLVVTSGTYTQTVTSSSPQQFSTNMFIAFAPSNQTGLHLVQIANGGGTAGSSSTHKTFPVPVIATDTLVAIGGWQSGAASFSGPTDSLGNSWTNVCGGGSNYYGAWRVASSAAGQDTITMNPSSITTTMKIFELAGVTGFDTATCAQLTGTSISPNQMTTAQANELLISFAVNSGACNPPFISLANSGNWINVGGSGSHCAQGAEGAQLTTSISTYGNPATSASSSTMAAGIFGFEGSAPASYVPPQVSGNVKISGNVHIQ